MGKLEINNLKEAIKTSMDFKNSETCKNLMRAFAGKVRPETVTFLRLSRLKKEACM